MRQSDEQNHQMTLQAGLRTLHEAGPELKRAISGNLDDMVGECDIPMHRVRKPFQPVKHHATHTHDIHNDVLSYPSLSHREIIRYLEAYGLV